MDYESDSVIKQILLVLQALLSVSLSVSQWLLSLGVLLSVPVLVMEAGEQIVMAGIPPVFGHSK